MKMTLVGVGRLRPALREVMDDYLRRLARELAVTEREVREAGRAPDRGSRIAEEDRRILGAIPEGAAVVLLDRGGKPWSSEQLASRLDVWRGSGRDMAIVIGGAEGTGAAVRDRATERWSLGPLTLPHELARVIAAEQLYRAAMILKGHPYHRRDGRPATGES